MMTSTSKPQNYCALNQRKIYFRRQPQWPVSQFRSVKTLSRATPSWRPEIFHQTLNTDFIVSYIYYYCFSRYLVSGSIPKAHRNIAVCNNPHISTCDASTCAPTTDLPHQDHRHMTGATAGKGSTKTWWKSHQIVVFGGISTSILPTKFSTNTFWWVKICPQARKTGGFLSKCI